MQEIQHLTAAIQDWLNGMMLRGINQLSPRDLEQLRTQAERAGQLHMDELSRLLIQLADSGQTVLMGQVGQEVLPDYFRLSAYVQMAQASWTE
ncbi:hypothetical protein [Paenibacillus wulumuqiensis]|uniref:hypothetical protein n=1 Tax=Paenibacillus wulumuqiensis TaxID=1567107 RepID=UPI0006190DAA|nr:hypothetical protein [Paenibacillus wulumuqiensis]